MSRENRKKEAIRQYEAGNIEHPYVKEFLSELEEKKEEPKAEEQKKTQKPKKTSRKKTKKEREIEVLEKKLQDLQAS